MGFWSFWGALFGLSGSGPPAVSPLVFADLGQEGGTDEVISPDPYNSCTRDRTP